MKSRTSRTRGRYQYCRQGHHSYMSISSLSFQVEDSSHLDFEALQFLKTSLSKNNSIFTTLQEHKLVKKIDAKIHAAPNQNIDVQRFKKTKKTKTNDKKRRFKSKEDPSDFQTAPQWTKSKKSDSNEDKLSEGLCNL